MKTIIGSQVDEHAEFIRLTRTYELGTETLKKRVMDVLDEQATEAEKGKRPGTNVAEAIRGVESAILSTLNQLGEEIPKATGASIHGTGRGRAGKTHSGPRE